VGSFKVQIALDSAMTAKASYFVLSIKIEAESALASNIWQLRQIGCADGSSTWLAIMPEHIGDNGNR